MPASPSKSSVNTQHNPLPETGPFHVDTSDFEPVEGAKGPQDVTHGVFNVDRRNRSRGLERRSLPPCVFRGRPGWGPCLYRADGQPDRIHWIPQQRIKAKRPDADLEDHRLIDLGCRHHHDLFDRKLRPFPHSAYPAKLLEWAVEHDFEFISERDGWRYCEPALDSEAASELADERLADEERLQR